MNKCRYIMTALLSAILACSLAAQPEPEKPIPPREVKDKPEQPPADEDKVDVSKTSERIADNAQKVSERLKEKDIGKETHQLQKDILRDLDALIRQSQNPPPSQSSPSPMSPMNPPPMGEQSNQPQPMPMPMGGQEPKGGQPKGGQQPMPKGGEQPMPMGGQQPKGDNSPKQPKDGPGSSAKEGKEPRENRGSRRERRQREPREPKGEQPSNQPMAKSPSVPKSPNPKKEDGRASVDPKEGKPMEPNERGVVRSSPKRQNDPLADLYKDAWGSLPDRMRQEMDLYYREQFMPRYSELLKQYYASIAEQKKKDGR